MQGSARQQRVGSLLVAAQLGLLVACLIPAGPVLGSGQLRPVGLICIAVAAIVGGLALLVLGRSFRVHPVPAARASLRTSGIYAWVRHPMYAALLLGGLGVTLFTGRVLALVALAGLGVVLHLKARFEDRLLEERFGWQFSVYASRVPALLPQPWRSHAR